MGLGRSEAAMKFTQIKGSPFMDTSIGPFHGPVAMHVAPQPHQVVPKGDGGHVGRIETRH